MRSNAPFSRAKKSEFSFGIQCLVVEIFIILRLRKNMHDFISCISYHSTCQLVIYGGHIRVLKGTFHKYYDR